MSLPIETISYPNDGLFSVVNRYGGSGVAWQGKRNHAIAETKDLRILITNRLAIRLCFARSSVATDGGDVIYGIISYKPKS